MIDFNCCRIPPPRYREIQLLEAGEPTLFIGGMSAGVISTSPAGVSLANCTTASASVVTTSFAPESRRRSAAWVMFSVALQRPMAIFRFGSCARSFRGRSGIVPTLSGSKPVL